MRRGGFPISHSVDNYMCNSKTKGRIYKDDCILYYGRYLFSWLELYARYNWRVMDQNKHRNQFPTQHFVRTYTHNSKTTGCMWTFYISNDCSTIEMSIICIRAGCAIPGVSYTSKHASQSVSNNPFCVYNVPRYIT